MIEKSIKGLLQYIPIGFNIKSIDHKANRTSFDKQSKEYITSIENRKNSLPTISAVFRVKNSSSILESAILSIVPICSEIIIVDNNSTDDTFDVANKIKNDLHGKVDVKIFTYSNQLALAGDGYQSILTEENSLANYYNFCSVRQLVTM